MSIERHAVLTAEVVASVSLALDDELPADRAMVLATYLAVAAGQLAVLEGPDMALITLSNISAALCGGGARQ